MRPFADYKNFEESVSEWPEHFHRISHYDRLRSSFQFSCYIVNVSRRSKTV